MKRFYDHVGVRPVDDAGNETMMATATGYKVLVQGRELRTNGMHDLVVGADWLTWACEWCALHRSFPVAGDSLPPRVRACVLLPAVLLYCGVLALLRAMLAR